MTETKLFFGFNNSDGTARVVSDEAWESFLARWVTPLFPGFTVLKAQGFWQGKPEESRLVVIFHEGSDQTDLDVITICRAYCETFQQNCVARADSTVTVTFQGA